jgi:hypothetical protein
VLRLRYAYVDARRHHVTVLGASNDNGVTDVAKGSNSVAFQQNGRTFAVRAYRAGPGYDLVTGVGTIDAARLVPELAAAAKAGP